MFILVPLGQFWDWFEVLVLLYPLPRLSNSLIAEWAWVIMNGMGSCLLVYGGLKRLQSWQGALLLWWGDGNKACTKMPFWYCGCSSVSLGLNWRKSHWHIQESRPNAEKLSPLKSCRLLLRLTCIFFQVVGVFHVVYCDDKKKKMRFCISYERHVFVATQIRLHSCYWVSQSLYWLSILALVIWPKT